MADVVDFKSGKKYQSDEESAVSADEQGEAPAKTLEECEIAMARALLDAEVDRKNKVWVEEYTKRRKGIRRLRLSMFILGVTFGLLHWWWAMAGAVLIMLFAKRAHCWAVKE